MSDMATTKAVRIPYLVYGTAWKKDQTRVLVYRALEAGFRGVDTAAQPKHYQEDLVGEGIREAILNGVMKRDELYVGLLILISCPWTAMAYRQCNRSKPNIHQFMARTQIGCHTILKAASQIK